MSKIYITGDIHGDPMRLSSKKFPEGKSLTKEDFVIVAGDFGIIWNNIPDREEAYYLKWLEEKPWTTLFVDGNHENFTRLYQFPVKNVFGGNVGVIRDSIYHLKRGEVYNLCGKNIFTFGGAMSVDKSTRKAFTEYWEEELPTYREMDKGIRTLNECNWNIDYIITHAPPMFLLESFFINIVNGKKRDPIGKYFNYIAESAIFTKWFFGHIHEDKIMPKYVSIFEDIIGLHEIN